jgi:hypothetical protein
LGPKLTKQFELVQKMTKQMSGLGAGGKMKAVRELARSDPSMMPGLRNMPGLATRASTKTASRRQNFKQRKKRK